MDMKKYHDETLKKLEKMSDEEFYRILKKVGVDCLPRDVIKYNIEKSNLSGEYYKENQLEKELFFDNEYNIVRSTRDYLKEELLAESYYTLEETIYNIPKVVGCDFMLSEVA